MGNRFFEHVTSRPSIAADFGHLASGPVGSYIVNYFGRTFSALAQLKMAAQVANVLGLVNAISDVAVKYFAKDSYARNLGPVAGAAVYFAFNAARGVGVDTKTLAIMTLFGVAISWATDRYVKATATNPGKPDPKTPNQTIKKDESDSDQEQTSVTNKEQPV